MPTTQLQLRRGNTAQTAIFTGAVGEVTVDTDKKTLIVHDGVTSGGTEISLKTRTDSAYDQANTATSDAATADEKAVSAGSYANSAYDQANTVTSDAATADQKAVTSGDYANSAFESANTATTNAVTSGDYANSAYSQANTATTNAATADQRAVTSGDYANSAFESANTVSSNLNSANTWLQTYVNTQVSNLVDSAPVALDTLNELAAALNDDSNFSTTITNMVGVSGSYANSAFGAANTADQRAVTSGDYANSAYSQANTGTVLAQAAFDSANNVGPQVQPAFNAANSAGSYANSAYATANSLFDGTATVFVTLVNSSDITSNGAMSISTGASGSSKDLTLSPSSGITKTSGTILIQDNDILALAQSAYGQGNTADQRAVTSGDYANSAYLQANTATTAAATADQKAVSAGSYANSAFEFANTGIADASVSQIKADAAFNQANISLIHANSSYDLANTINISFSSAFPDVNARLVVAFSHANSAYDQANTATSDSATTGSYSNSAYTQANTATTNAATADQRAVTSGSYANSAYAQANTATTNAATADQRAVTSGGYANSAYIHANSAYDHSNTKFSSTGGFITGFANVSSNISVGSFVDFNNDIADPSNVEGRVWYDAEHKSLSYYNDSTSYVHIGQDSVSRVWNNTGSTIGKANCVFIIGQSSANGWPSVAPAQASFSANSEVIGLTTTDIPAGGYGFVMRSGRIQGIDTSSFTGGEELFLSDTPGRYTTSVPQTPSVPLNVGYISAVDLTEGAILVNIHLMEGSNKNDGSILFARNNKLDQDNETLFWDYTNKRLGIGTNEPTANLHVTGDGLFSGNVTISGNLIVSNAQSITTSELTVGGNTIVLNSDVTGTPTSNATIVVNRGNEANVYIRWDEIINEWVMYEAGAYPEGHVLHSEKTAHDWSMYTAMPAYEKLTHPVGASLSNATNEHATAGYITANIASAHAVAGFVQANTADQRAVTSGVYANSAYTQANTATTNAATADQRAVTSGDYANSAYAQANSAFINSASASSYANSAFTKANTATTNAATADQKAVSAGSYANSAYSRANTATTNAATADQRAVTSGNYANSAYLQANTAIINASAASSYANSSYARANTSLINNGSTSTTGTIYAAGLVSNTSVTLNTSSVISSTGITTSTTSQVTADSWSSSTYRSAKYFVQITSGSSYHVLEMSVLHDGTTAYMVTYGEQFTGSSLGNFSATVSGGLLSLLFTPTNASTSVRINKTLMVV